MWKTIGKWAVEIAIFAFNHKDEVIAAVNAVAEAKAAKQKAE